MRFKTIAPTLDGTIRHLMKDGIFTGKTLKQAEIDDVMDQFESEMAPFFEDALHQGGGWDEDDV